MIPKSITNRIERTDRGVSPVIGVILMVAITVILAAVIGTFVLDLGQSAGNSAPSASLTVTTDTSAGNFTISHKGGDGLVGSNTRIQVTDESGGSTITFQNSSDVVFGVGNEVVVDATNGQLSSDGDVWAATSGDGTFSSVDSGSQYSIQVIDTESQRVIFETTITA